MEINLFLILTLILLAIWIGEIDAPDFDLDKFIYSLEVRVLPELVE
jgi:hypothetical protein